MPQLLSFDRICVEMLSESAAGIQIPAQKTVYMIRCKTARNFSSTYVLALLAILNTYVHNDDVLPVLLNGRCAGTVLYAGTVPYVCKSRREKKYWYV